MPVTPSKTRIVREPLSSQAIIARVFAIIFLILLGVVIFVYPWLFTLGGR